MRKIVSGLTGLLIVLLLSVSAMAAANKSAEVPVMNESKLVYVDKGISVIDETKMTDLEKQLKAINEKYDIHAGVVFLKNLPKGMTAEKLAKSIVEGKGGFEKGKKGSIVFLVSADSRDYYIATGRNLNKIITSSVGIEYMKDKVLPELKNDRFSKAAVVFAETTEKEMAYYAETGKPFDPSNEFSPLAAGLAVLLALLGGYGVRSYLIGQMSNVHREVAADAYLERDTFSLTEKEDTYLYTDVKVVPKAKDSDTTSSDSGSTGGGGGKF